MSNLLLIIFLGSILQLLWLSYAGIKMWIKLNETEQITFIKRWSQNISLEVLNKLSLPVFTFLLSLYFSDLLSATILPRSHDFDIMHFIVSLLIIDMIFYWRHRLYHLYLSRWHCVHHNDSDFDISITLRFHPFENLINYLIMLAGLTMLSVSSWEAVLIIQIFAFQAMLSHTYSTAKKRSLSLNNLWSYIFITPKTHHMHHEYNSSRKNYGFLFSTWDQFFGTYAK